jgi:hypothetical protein
MLKVTDPKKFQQVSYFFQILVPHCYFRLMECQLLKEAPCPNLYKSIDEYIESKRSLVVSSPIACMGPQTPSTILALIDKFKSKSIFQSWLLKTLEKHFGFTLKLQVQAQQMLYSESMIFVLNAV